MNLSQALTSLLLLGATTSFAGNVRGNGGGGIVCRNNGAITSVTTLDVYEAAFREINLDFGPEQSTPLGYVNFVLDRLKRLDPQAAESYRALANKFFDADTSRFKPGITLPFTEDTGPVAPPVGCALEQIVLQMKPAVPEDRLFTVNKDLFDRLDSQNKAALILHEVIYHELIPLRGVSYGTPLHPNSFYARYYNETILSQRISEMTPEEYISKFGQDITTPDNDKGCIMSKAAHTVNWRGIPLNVCLSQANSTESGYKLTFGAIKIDLNKDIEFKVGEAIFNLRYKDLDYDLAPVTLTPNSMGGLNIKASAWDDIVKMRYGTYDFAVGKPYGNRGSMTLNFNENWQLQSLIPEDSLTVNGVVFDGNGDERSWNYGLNKCLVFTFNQSKDLISIRKKYDGTPDCEFILRGPFEFIKVDGYKSVARASGGHVCLVDPKTQKDSLYAPGLNEFSSIYLDRNFKPYSATIASSSPVKFKLARSGPEFTSLIGEVQFRRIEKNESFLNRGTLAESATLFDEPSRSWRTFSSGTTLNFNGSGEVTN